MTIDVFLTGIPGKGRTVRRDTRDITSGYRLIEVGLNLVILTPLGVYGLYVVLRLISVVS